MAKLSNIDAAYEYLKEKKKSAALNDIWTAIAKNSKELNDNKAKLLATLYSDLVLDNRFSLTTDGKWALSSNMKYDDVKKHYDYVASVDLDQDLDQLEEEKTAKDSIDDVNDDSNDVDDTDKFTEIDEDEDDEHFVLDLGEDSYGNGDEK